MNGTLAKPVEARLDSELRIIEADPALRRLHMHADGSFDTPLAVPQLAALCRQAQRFGTTVARSVRAADEDHNIVLWAEARPEIGGVHLIIRSWRRDGSTASRHAFDAEEASRLSAVGDSDNRCELQLDAQLSVIGASGLPEAVCDKEAIGKSLSQLFRIDEEPVDGRQSILAAVAERQPFSDRPVIARATGLRFLLAARPLFDGEGGFAGYLCHLRADEGKEAGADEVQKGEDGRLLSGAAFGPEFASALRQPVGRILANAETIAGRQPGPLRESYVGYAGDIVEAARHLQALIDDLSDLEAIERPGFAPEPDAVDLADLGRRAAGLLAVKASDHQMRIEAPPADQKVPATGEFRRILQILVNLVTNAIRYSPDGSTVWITASSESGRAQIRVRDEGGGIAEENRERIFEKFERLGRGGDNGSGLGLYISRRIAQALGGSLTVERSGPDGTTFLLDLPARQG